MDLQKIATLLKEASAEIKKLKEENAQLKARLDSMDKVASYETEDNMIGFGNVSEDEYSDTPNNPKDLFMRYFG